MMDEMEAISELVKRQVSKIAKDSEIQGFSEDEKQAIVQGTLAEVMNHKPCDDSNCGICNMKNQIYEHGVKSGIGLERKYPERLDIGSA